MLKRLFRKPNQASDNMIANIIANCHITRVEEKPYFTIDGVVWTFNGGNLVCVQNGGIVSISPTAHMFLNAHLNTVPVVNVH